MEAAELVNSYFERLGEVLDTIPRQPIQDAVEAVVLATGFGRTIYFEGREASVSTAQFVVERLPQLLPDAVRPRLQALAIAPDAADYAGTVVFSPGDVVFILADAMAPSVLDIAYRANRTGAVTVGLTGSAAHDLMLATDHCLVIPTSDRSTLSEMQIVVCDLIAALLSRSPPPVLP